MRSAQKALTLATERRNRIHDKVDFSLQQQNDKMAHMNRLAES